MIQFFRRIRQKLITEGSLSLPTGQAGKYLIYAVGEILLVVIGILIALQVNNWNETRKLDKKETQLYRELISELEGNLGDVRNDQEDYERNFNALLKVRDMFVEDALEADTLLKYGHFITDLEFFTAKTSAFESLKSLGLNIIKNDSLRKDITTLYQIKLPDLNDSEEQNERSRLRDAIIDDLHKYLMVDYTAIKKGKEKGLRAFAPDFRYLKMKNIKDLANEDLLIVNIQQSLVWLRIINGQHKKSCRGNRTCYLKYRI